MHIHLALVAAAVLLAAAPAQAATAVYSGTFVPEGGGGRTGTGTLTMQYDDVGHTLAINATFSGLSGTTSTAHIHCCTPTPATGTAGVALATGGILPGFPLGVQAGSYVQTIDLTLTSNYSGGFVTASGGTAAGAELALINALTAQAAYFNIHSSTFGGGEIRTFVTVVPDADVDGILDANDNCTVVSNATQLDTDSDGYGNMCDGDLNNSGTVTTADFGMLRSVLGQPASFSPLAAAADMNGSGNVSTADFGMLRARLGTAPGPSGLSCAGTIPCP